MKTKLFKIGEYSSIPNFRLTKKTDQIVLFQGYDYDNKLIETKVFENCFKLYCYLEEITTPYYVDKVYRKFYGEINTLAQHFAKNARII
jgi:hypothetical protein